MTFLKSFLLLIIIPLCFLSCKKNRGCTDPEALNFNKSAQKDDHSCYYFWIGQSYGGGKIFYIDQTKKHGLIAATFSLGISPWGCDNTVLNQTNGTFVGQGFQNTQSIVNNCPGFNAASLCYNLDTLGYDDWYLPSAEELLGLSKTLGYSGEANLGTSGHWSSSENDSTSAWGVYFSQSIKILMGKTDYSEVRAIRSF
jgi:hypothetical protein